MLEIILFFFLGISIARWWALAIPVAFFLVLDVFILTAVDPGSRFSTTDDVWEQGASVLMEIIVTALGVIIGKTVRRERGRGRAS